MVALTARAVEILDEADIFNMKGYPRVFSFVGDSIEFSREFRRVADLAGFEGLRFVNLRDEARRRMIADRPNVSLDDLSQMLGFGPSAFGRYKKYRR